MAAARVTLTARTAAQLTVHPATVVALRSDDGQSTRGLDLIGELDVRSPTGHVGGDGDRSRLTGAGHNFCLSLVPFRVENLMLDFPNVQHPTEQFADLHGRGAHQDRSACIAQFDHVVDDGIELLPLGLEDQIVLILPSDGTVGRDGHDVELVDVPQLLGFRFRRAGHAG